MKKEVKTLKSYAEYHIDEKDRIVYRTFYGVVDGAAILESFDFLINNDFVDSTYLGIISDYRHCDLEINLEVVEQLSEYYHSKHWLFSRIKTVQVIDDHRVAFIYVFDAKNPDFKSIGFSTLEEAIKWLKTR